MTVLFKKLAGGLYKIDPETNDLYKYEKSKEEKELEELAYLLKLETKKECLNCGHSKHNHANNICEELVGGSFRTSPRKCACKRFL